MRKANKAKKAKDAARLKMILDKKKARENRKNTPSAWDIHQAKKKKEAAEKAAAAKKAAKDKLKNWKCKKGKRGKSCRQKRKAARWAAKGNKPSVKAGPAIKKGDPLDINMKLVDKAAQKDLDAHIKRRTALKQRSGHRGTFIGNRGPVYCDGSRGSKLPAGCDKVAAAVKQWLATQKQLARSGRRNFKAAIAVAKGEIKAPKKLSWK